MSSLLWASLYKIAHVQMLKDDEGGNVFIFLSFNAESVASQLADEET